MGMSAITLTGGLELVRAQTETPPGRLRACKNFEQTARDGYSKIEGIRAYSGECVLGNRDGWLIYDGNASITVSGALYEGTATWGTGQFVDPDTGVIQSYAGRARLGFVNSITTTAYFFVINSIQGRFPTTGDTITFQCSTGSASAILTGSLVRLSAAIDSISPSSGWTFPILDVEDAAPIADLYSDIRWGSGLADFTSARGLPVLCSPKGFMCGGFYFQNKAHVIVDALTIRFNSGSTVIAPGDKLRIDWEDIGTTPRLTYLEVQSVTIESGTFDGSDAAGTFTAILDPASTDPLQWALPDGDNGTINGIENASGTTVAGFVSYETAKTAFMFRDTGVSNINTQGWEKVDLGHEVGFNTGGTTAFTVVNRVNKNNLVEATTPTATDWKLPTTATATGWTSASNILLDDGSVATSAMTTPFLPSDPITVTGFDFEVPAGAVITGVEVRIDRAKSGGAGTGEVSDYNVSLVGVESSHNKAKTDLYPASSALAKTTYGGNSDIWGASLTPELVNTADFGVKLLVQQTTGTLTQAVVDCIEVRIHYKPPISKVYFRTTSAPTVTVASITRSGQTATATITAGHGYYTGQWVTMAGASQTEYNGTFQITVTGTTTFEYTVTGSPATPATGSPTAKLSDVSSADVVWYYKKKGDFTTSDAEGTLTLANASHPTQIQAGMQIRTATGGTGTLYALTSSGAEMVTLDPSGALEANGSQYQTVEANFYGSSASNQVFGVSGGGYAWSFDGTYFIRIRTGLEAAQDKPRHVAKHLFQLALGYSHGEVILSDAGYPESYAAVFGGSSPASNNSGFAGGASAVAMGDAVHGLVPLAEQSLGVFGRNYIQQIVGSGSGLTPNMISPSSGVIEYSVRDASPVVFLDYKGVGTLGATAAYGNFARGRLSRDISPWLVPRIQDTGNRFNSARGFVRAELVRAKNQVRYYFRDRAVLTMTLQDEGAPSFTTQEYPFTVTATFSGVDSSGKDHVFIGGYAAASDNNPLLLKRKAFQASGDGLIAASAFVQSSFPGMTLYESDVGATWADFLPIDGYIEFDIGQVGGFAFANEVKYERMLMTGLCYGYYPLGAQYGQDFEAVDTSGTTNATVGSRTAVPSRAFSEQTFSTPVSILRSGKQLRVRIVSSGASHYDGTSAPSSGFLRYRPATLQSVVVIDEQQHVKR